MPLAFFRQQNAEGENTNFNVKILLIRKNINDHRNISLRTYNTFFICNQENVTNCIVRYSL